MRLADEVGFRGITKGFTGESDDSHEVRSQGGASRRPARGSTFVGESRQDDSDPKAA